MPLGIMMSKAEIMDWVPGSHASTFGGNPVSIAAAWRPWTFWNVKASRMPRRWAAHHDRIANGRNT